MASCTVFIDHGYPDGNDFLIAFLSSGEFLETTLSHLSGLKSKSETKREHTNAIVQKLSSGTISKKDILVALATQRRTYVSFMKISERRENRYPELFDPVDLLTSFGQEGWYGPIVNEEDHYFYIRTYRIQTMNADNPLDLNSSSIRWTIVAEIRDSFLFLSWNNFGYITPSEEFERNSRTKEFAYWLYINNFYDEIASHINLPLENIDLGHLIMTDIWNRYYEDDRYRWNHIAINANSSGVAFNARSAIRDINLQGISRLSSEISRTALTVLGVDFTEKSEEFSHVNSSVLNLLIKDWDPKSYEFSLENQNQTIFKAHCYFGYGLLAFGEKRLTTSINQKKDLPHLHCYHDCNGTRGVIIFLLENQKC